MASKRRPHRSARCTAGLHPDSGPGLGSDPGTHLNKVFPARCAPSTQCPGSAKDVKIKSEVASSSVRAFTLSRTLTLASRLARSVSQVASLSGAISVQMMQTAAETTMATMLPASEGPEALVVVVFRTPVAG